jgi:hypothetical protein
MNDFKEIQEILIELLIKWQKSEITEQIIHERAEALADQYKSWPKFSRSKPQSIPFEVLSQLDILNAQWIIKDDVPIILEFLKTSKGKEEEAWEKWLEYWNNVDYEKRRNLIKHNEYYLT